MNLSEGLNIPTASYLFVFFVFIKYLYNYFPTSLFVEPYELKHKSLSHYFLKEQNIFTTILSINTIMSVKLNIEYQVFMVNSSLRTLYFLRHKKNNYLDLMCISALN